MITFGTVDDHKTKDGVEWVEACKTLEAHGADIVGFNCSRGPTTMLPMLKELRKAVKCHIAAQPVPYNTTPECPIFHRLKDRHGKNAFSLSLESHLLTRFDMAEFAKEAKEIGVNFIGVCCGGSPHYLRSMAEALGRTVPASKYSADFSQHAMLGSDEVVKKHEKKYEKTWNKQ